MAHVTVRVFKISRLLIIVFFFSIIFSLLKFVLDYNSEKSDTYILKLIVFTLSFSLNVNDKC